VKQKVEFQEADMIWAIINFIILLFILNKFLYRPLMTMLDDRKNKIKEDLDSAAVAKQETEKMQADYAAQMALAKQEAQQIIEKATKIGEETRESILNQAREESAKMTEKAKEIIRLEKEEALNQLRDEVASLVVLAAGKVIDKTIDQKAHEKLIHDFIEEVGDAS
jgi:F-type H+-transporting ATPase subunit b